MGHFDPSYDGAGRSSERLLPGVPASPVPNTHNIVGDSSTWAAICHLYIFKWIQRFVKSWVFWPNYSRNFHIFYLCVFKNLLLLIAVDVDTNRCPITTCPTESVDDSRTIREDYPQTLQWKKPSTDPVKLSGFASTAEWLWKSPNTPRPLETSCISTHNNRIIIGIQLSMYHVPGSWRWCCLQDLCTQSCQLFPLGRFCPPQQISASRRPCQQSWAPNPPSSHRLHLCPHSHSHIWTKHNWFY